MSNRKIILLVILLSFLLRVGIAYLMRDSFFERGNRYSLINPIAHNIIKFREFSMIPGSPTANNEPFYPLFVALAYFFMGTNWFSLALLQSVVNIINALIVYVIAMGIFRNQKMAFISFLLFIFYPFYVFQCISISDTVLFCFLLGLIILLMIKNPYIGNFWSNIFTGITWGLTLLTRFSSISLLPFALMYIFMRLPSRKAVKSCILIFLMCLLTISPWLYRNYSLTGKIFVVTLRGALAVWYGYNSDSFGVIRENVSVDSMGENLEDKVPGLREIENKEYPASINREVDMTEILLKHALNFALSNPWLCLKMMPIKFWKFWTWNYNPVPTSEDKNQDVLRRKVYIVSYLPLLIFAILGIVLTRKNWRTLSIFYLLFFGYSLLHTILYGFTRLRVPIDQFLMIFAANAIVFYLGKLKKIFS